MKSRTGWMAGWALAAIAGTATFAGADPVALELEFNQADRLGKQKAGLADAALAGDVAADANVAGAADFGFTGRLHVEKFRQPQGPFSVEARFRLRSYGAAESLELSDIVSTATWDLPGPQPLQGFVLRVGGGATYPTLPSDGDNPSVYARCVGELVVGAKGSEQNWMEAYTHRCLDLDRWIHLVGVWDGKEVRVYLDGHDATDYERLRNPGMASALFPEAALTVGARGASEEDIRHFDGIMDFLRVEGHALTPEQIYKRYRKTLRK